MLIQLAGSVTAIAVLVGLAAWARIARVTPPLDVAGARALLAEEFPDEPVDAVWIAADGTGVVARSGDQALVLWRKGDGYVARDTLWSQAAKAAVVDGRVRLKLGDGSPRLALSDGAWPPRELAA